MVLLVIWLFIETREAVNREKLARQDGTVTHTLKRERYTYAVITTFFGLSYIGRHFEDVYVECGYVSKSEFWILNSSMIVYLIEGMSLGVLMLFHFANFKQGMPILSHDDKTSVIILREEFDTEEVISTQQVTSNGSHVRSLLSKPSFLI